MSEDLVEIRQHFLWGFSGDFPEVPLAEGVSLDELQKVDPDPLFVTLPFVQDNGVSSDGLVYTEDFNTALIEQVNRKRPTGNMGHPSPFLSASRSDVPPILWVGAIRDANGRGWVKGFVRDPDVKSFLRALKAAGAGIGTSIMGRAQREGIREESTEEGEYRYYIDPQKFSLMSIDLFEPDGVALKMERPVVLTRHSEDVWDFSEGVVLLSEDSAYRPNKKKKSKKGKVDMDDLDKVVSQYAEEIANLKQALREEVLKNEEATAELLRLQEEVNVLRQALSVATEELFDYRLRAEIRQAVNLSVDNAGVLHEYVMNAVLARLGGEKDIEKAKALIAETLSSPTYKALTQAVVYQASGGPLLFGQDGGRATDEELQKKVDVWLNQYGVRV
ncbi:MAG: hypothetical protein QXS68_03155 [Candidatus Methanomethylicaceae archaeon]